MTGVLRPGPAWIGCGGADVAVVPPPPKPSSAHQTEEEAAAAEALRFEAGTMIDSARSQDFADGAKAWAAGRKPEFKGR